jgi:hypothetical protein
VGEALESEGRKCKEDWGEVFDLLRFEGEEYGWRFAVGYWITVVS